jgi:RNA polymerase sigma factor (sigma-70 family)
VTAPTGRRRISGPAGALIPPTMSTRTLPPALACARVQDVDTTTLLRRASEGDEAAWGDLVDRYAGVVWSVARGFRFDDATAADVSQTVWLRLAERHGSIRDPERLAGWLATTTRHECYRITRRRRREVVDDDVVDPRATDFTPVDEALVAADETVEALAAFAQLPDHCRELLRLLCADPPPDYATIAGTLGRPIGSIGPTRQRCLERLRRLVGAGATEEAP